MLEQIIHDHANVSLIEVTGKKKDFIQYFEYFKSFDVEKISVKDLYDKHKNKDIDSFYPLEELEESFFLFPKFDIVKEEYLQKNLDFHNALGSLYLGKDIKHYDLEKKISSLNNLLELSNSLSKTREEFIEKFTKNLNR